MLRAFRLGGALAGAVLALAGLVGGTLEELVIRLSLLALGAYLIYMSAMIFKPPKVEELERETEERASGPV